MADLYTLIDKMIKDGMFTRVAGNAAAQFGTPRRTYLGASILPERNVDENAYTEDAIRYRTVVANSGTRYSPSQKRGEGLITGNFQVLLGESDVAREFTSRDYDALLKVLGRGDSLTAQLQLINWTDLVINRALVELLEAQRWDAIVNASVVRKGDNGYTETVAYSNPAGHRVAAGGAWSNDAYDPYPDIVAMVDVLADKGYTCNRIITSRRVANILARNDKMTAKTTGRIIVQTDNSIVRTPGQRSSLADINGIFNADGIPNMELYDLTYNTEAASLRFMADDVMVFIATTGRDEDVLVGEQLTVVPDTLGYTAIGRPAGQSAAGRVIRVEAFSNKPPRVEAEGWQTALPVITEPEAIGVITGIA